jgi:hypothetical protein
MGRGSRSIRRWKKDRKRRKKARERRKADRRAVSGSGGVSFLIRANRVQLPLDAGE